MQHCCLIRAGRAGQRHVAVGRAVQHRLGGKLVQGWAGPAIHCVILTTLSILWLPRLVVMMVVVGRVCVLPPQTRQLLDPLLAHAAEVRVVRVERGAAD